MSEEKYLKGEGNIDPELGKVLDRTETIEVTRMATVFFTAEKLAQKKYGTSIEGLRQRGEPKEDYTEIKDLISEANKIVGPTDEYLYDHAVWENTKQEGEETQSFEEWRKKNREDYCQRLQNLEAEEK